MIVNFKEDEGQLEFEGRAVVELEIEDSDFADMEADMEEEGLDYD